MSRPYVRTKLPQPVPELLTFALLNQFPKLYHGISTRHSEGRQSYDSAVQQVHGTDFIWLRQPPHQSHQPIQADAIVLSAADRTARIGISDCVPIVLYDPQCHCGGLVHAGFKGTTQGILASVLTQFHPRHVYIGLGPAIGPECYDHIDIQSENILQAQAAGVPLDCVEVMRWCTKCYNDVFFSHRAGDHRNFGAYLRLAKT